MNLEQKEKSGFSFAFAGITVAVAMAALILLTASFAFLLLKMDHFESYYQGTGWLILVLTGVIIGALSRKNPDFAILNAALSAAFLSLLRFGIGLAVNRAEMEGFLQILVESAALVAISVLTTALLAVQKKKKKRSTGKFKFGSR